MAKHNEIGKQGEKLAEKYLETKGFTILEKNFHAKQGEIDIIATKSKNLLHVKHDNIAFIEVKTKKIRNNYNPINDIYSPEHNLTPSKRQKLLKTIRYYLSLKNIEEGNIDIKIMAIIVFLNEEEKKASFKLYENFIL